MQAGASSALLFLRVSVALAAAAGAVCLSPGAARAAPPVITNVQVAGDQLRVGWTLPDGESADYVEVGSSPAMDVFRLFVQPVASEDLDPSATAWTSPSLQPGTYYVHVRGLDDDGNEDWSDVQTATISAPPSSAPGAPSGPVNPPPSPSPSPPSGTPVPPSPGPEQPNPWSWSIAAGGSNLSVGLYTVPAAPTFQSLIDSFGPPDQCAPKDGGAVAAWRLIGLAALITSSSPRPRETACANPGDFYLRRIALTGQQWVTPAGLHVGDSVALLHFLYPTARFHRDGSLTGYRLRAAPQSDSSRPIDLIARIRGASVTSIVLVLAGELRPSRG